METIHEELSTVGTNKFQSDTLSFEELQELEKVKKSMLKWDYYTFNDIFHAL